MQLRDPGLLISIVGIPTKLLKGILNREIDAYEVASSSEGLLCIRKYWDSHCSTITKLPAIALLDSSSYPRGLSDSDFLQLLTRLTDLKQWQIWDLWDILDIHSCGHIGCQEFTLLVVLMCAGLSQQQLHVVHSHHSSICRVFAGAHVVSHIAGLMQCCQLLSLPLACLAAAMHRLQPRTLNTPATKTHKMQIGCSSNSNSGRQGNAIYQCKCHSRHANDAMQLSAVAKESSSQLGCCSEDSSGLQITSRYAGPGPKLLRSGSSNRVLPQGKSETSEQLCCCTDSVCPEVTTMTTFHQDVQLLLYLTIERAQGQQAIHDKLPCYCAANNHRPASCRHRSNTVRRSNSCVPSASRHPKPCCIGCIIS